MEGEMKGSNRVTKVLELNNEYVIELLYTTKNDVSGHMVIFFVKNCVLLETFAEEY